MSPSQMMLRGAFCILLPKTTIWNYGRFLGNIHYDDHWIRGHFHGCQNSQESTPN